MIVKCIKSETCISRLVSGCEHIQEHELKGDSCCSGYCGIAEKISFCSEVKHEMDKQKEVS